MKIKARVHNAADENHVTLSTDDRTHTLHIPTRPSGLGLGANGGELLCLALAACYCNDVYREAGLRGIRVEGVEVEAEAEFGAPGAPGTNVTYRTRITAHAGEEEIQALAHHTDTVAEIHNTLRAATPVTLSGAEAVSR